MPAAVVDQTGYLDLKEILTSLHYCAVEGSTSPYNCAVEGSNRRSGLLELLTRALVLSGLVSGNSRGNSAGPRQTNLIRGGEF